MKYLKVLSYLIVWSISISAYSNTYTVVNTLNSGTGSLSEAITSANNHSGADTVAFNIPFSDAGFNGTDSIWIITLTSMLPYIADYSGGLIYIDGNTQTINKGNCNPDGPEIIIQDGNALTTCFVIASPNNTIRSLTITGFTYGVTLYNSTCTNSTIRDMYLGTNFDGTLAVPNDYGVGFSNGATGNHVINCLISGNTQGKRMKKARLS